MKPVKKTTDLSEIYDIYTLVDDQYGHFLGFAHGERTHVRKAIQGTGFVMVGKSLMFKKREYHASCIHKTLPLMTTPVPPREIDTRTRVK